MPYRPPLVPYETFVADPPDLPVRGPGEQGLSALARAELLATDAAGATFKAETTDGESLSVAVGAAGDGRLTVELPAALRLHAATGGRVVDRTPTALTAEVRAGEALAVEALPSAR